MTNGDWFSGLVFLVALAISIGEFGVLTGRIENPWWRIWPADFPSVNLALFLFAAGAALVLGVSFVSGLVG